MEGKIKFTAVQGSYFLKTLVCKAMFSTRFYHLLPALEIILSSLVGLEHGLLHRRSRCGLLVKSKAQGLH